MNIGDASSPILTIVIPTRNRQLKALSAAQSILKLGSDDIQVVLHDCSDTNTLPHLLGDQLSDPRLTFAHVDEPLSLTDNFESAANLIEGEYVLFIGDDDLATPEAIEVARWAKTHDIDSVRSDFYAYYFWPDLVGNPTLGDRAARLELRSFSGAVDYVDSQRALELLVAEGGQNYLYFALPKIYHGIVRLSCLARAKEESGSWFGGLSPDIYGTVAVSKYVKRAVAIAYPFTVNGTSAGSGAADSAAGAHRGRLEDAPHLRGKLTYQWSKIVPRFYSVATIWADSAVAALEATNQYEMLGRFSVPTLTAYCIVQNPTFTLICVRELLRISRETKKSPFVEGAIMIYHMLRLVAARAKRLLARVLGIRKRTEVLLQEQDVPDSESAVDLLMQYLASAGTSFARAVHNAPITRGLERS